jgi:hypothetical protein
MIFCYVIPFSLCQLCVLGVSVVNLQKHHHKDTEITENAQSIDLSMRPDALVSAEAVFHQALQLMLGRRRFSASAAAPRGRSGRWRRRCFSRFDFHFIDHYCHGWFSLLQFNSKTSTGID